MQYIAFGNTGFQVSRLGIGSLAVGPTPEAQADVVRIMNMLLDEGANLVDTAQCYARSEELIGRELAHRRDEYFLLSKCGHHNILPDGSMRSREISMEDIDTALRKLRTDHLDAMVLHSYDYDMLQRGDALDVLRRAKDAGKIRFYGYSGDNERAEWAVREGDIDILETSISLVDQHNSIHTLPAAREKGVAVVAKRPLANAAWRLVDRPEEANEHVRPYVDRFIAMTLSPDEYGCEDFSELALRFTLSIEGLHTAIASSRNPSHISHNLALVDKGPLSAPVVTSLRERFAAVQQDWGGCN